MLVRFRRQEAKHAVTRTTVHKIADRLGVNDTVDIKPIKSAKNYRAALGEIEKRMAAKANTPDGDRLDVLVTLVEAYERRHYPMDLPDAVESIKFRMEQQGLTVDDLSTVLGRKNRVYEVLSRTRPLTLRMIKGLHTTFCIPAESLLKQKARTHRRAA